MSEIQTGERYTQSPMTGNFYLVTKWKELSNHMVAIEKEEVELSDVPEEKLCEYCKKNIAVEWSSQERKVCSECP